MAHEAQPQPVFALGVNCGLVVGVEILRRRHEAFLMSVRVNGYAQLQPLTTGTQEAKHNIRISLQPLP